MTVALVATSTEFNLGIVMRISSIASCSMTSGSSPIEMKKPIHARNRRLNLANISAPLVFGHPARRDRVLGHEVAHGCRDCRFLLALPRLPGEEFLLLALRLGGVLVDSRAQLGD